LNNIGMEYFRLGQYEKAPLLPDLSSEAGGGILGMAMQDYHQKDHHRHFTIIRHTLAKKIVA